MMPRNLFNTGSVLQRLGRNKDALAAYEEAARIGPLDAETELNRGNVLQKLGRLQEALASAITALCNAARIIRRPSITKGSRCRRSAAPSMLLRPMTRLSRRIRVIVKRAAIAGNVLHELGRLDEPSQLTAGALKIRPGFLPALTNRANILLQRGSLDQALVELR